MHEEIRDRAFRDYQKGMKYKEIADRYGVSLSAVKSWAARYWKSGCDQKEKSCNHKDKRLQPEKKKSQPEKKKAAAISKNTEAIAQEVSEVIENPDLTDRQRLFCLYYIRCFNATQAYSSAYPESSYETAMVEGSRLLRNPKTVEEIRRLKQGRLNRAMLEPEDIFEKYMQIAFADMNRQADIRGGMVRVSDSFDGTIVSEVSETQNGIKIKLNDRMKALQWLTDHMDMATEEQKARIALLKAKAQTDEPQDPADDGFLESLDGIAEKEWKEWKDEEDTGDIPIQALLP